MKLYIVTLFGSAVLTGRVPQFLDRYYINLTSLTYLCHILLKTCRYSIQVDDEIMAISEFCVFITVSVYYVLIFYYLPLLTGLYILCNLYNLLWLVVPHCGKLYRVMRVYRQKMRKLEGNKYPRGVLPNCVPSPYELI